MSKVIYSAAFLGDKESGILKAKFPPVHPNVFYHHLTIEFAPADINNIEIGKEVILEIKGRLTTDKLDVLVASFPKSKNKYPHITLSTAEGIKPGAAGNEIANNYDKIIWFGSSLSIPAKEGVFNGNVITKK